MKGRLTLLNGLIVPILLMCPGLTMAYGSSSAVLEVSTFVLPEAAPAMVRALNAEKEALAAYAIHPSHAMEKVHFLSMIEEAKGDAGKIKIISVIFN